MNKSQQKAVRKAVSTLEGMQGTCIELGESLGELKTALEERREGLSERKRDGEEGDALTEEIEHVSEAIAALDGNNIEEALDALGNISTEE